MSAQALEDNSETTRVADDRSATGLHGADLEEHIAHAIRRMSLGQIHRLKVHADRSVVVLEGQTTWYRWKKAAQDVAMQLAENVELLNEIEVEGTRAERSLPNVEIASDPA